VLVKRALFLLNATLAIAVLRLISQVHLPSFVKMLPKYLKDVYIYMCIYIYIGLREAFVSHTFRPNTRLIDDDPFSAEKSCKQKCLMYIMNAGSCHRLCFSYFLAKNVFIVSFLVFSLLLSVFYTYSVYRCSFCSLSTVCSLSEFKCH